MITPQHLLLCRTDNIGDVVLTIPMLSIIKEKWPNCRVTLLLRKYTKELASLFPQADAVIDRESVLAMPPKAAALALQERQFDVCIFANRDKNIAKLVKQAHIKWRIGKIYWDHLFTCNKRMYFSKRKLALHETLAAVKLLEPLGVRMSPAQLPLTPKVHMPTCDRTLFADLLDLKDKRFKLIMHPGSNGSGREWPCAHFKKLISLLDAQRFQIFVTGSEVEKQTFAGKIDSHLPHVTHVMGRFSLNHFIQFMSQVNGIVASGTGPLHLAAAMGLYALGLFPPHKQGGPRRWQPMGRHAEYLAQSKCDSNQSCSNTQCPCMWAITPEQVHTVLQRWERDYQAKIG